VIWFLVGLLVGVSFMALQYGPEVQRWSKWAEEEHVTLVETLRDVREARAACDSAQSVLDEM
jgi:hypothetical protein